MRLIRYIVLLSMICLLTACAGASPESSALLLLDATLSPQAPAATVLSTTSAPVSPSEYLLTIMPKCDGIQILDQPVTFPWPNIKQRLKELEKSYQGYYTCSQPVAEVTPFYRKNIIKPPYNMNETNWVERPEGTLGLYYHSPTQTWLYLWIVPQPDNAQASLIIAAQSDASIFQPGECRLDARRHALWMNAGEQ